MYVQSNIIQRTFAIRNGKSCGTCFSVDIDNRRYLVTARHVVNNIHDQGRIEIFHNSKWKSLTVRLVGNGSNDIDVSVLAPGQLFGPSNELLVDTAGLMLSEEVYFLGFPYGLKSQSANLNAQFPFPLVKKGIVSAIQPNRSGDCLLFLDGHNNPGFSGGPVVRGKKPNQVIGVVSGYKSNKCLVLDQRGREGPYTYDVNTGIIVAYNVNQINELILNNPIGINVR